MSRTVPDWVIQTCWWTSGIFATGALWYFLSIKDYYYVTGSGAFAVAFAIAAIALHRRKDRLPDDYVRRSLDEPTDLRFFQSLPELKVIARRTAQPGWDTGATIEMRKATHDVLDFYEFIWLKLAEFYPVKQFGKEGAEAHIKSYIRERYKFHWAKHEPGGFGTGGTIVGVLAGGDVMEDLDRLIVETATALVGCRGNFDIKAWLARWEGSDLSDHA